VVAKLSGEYETRVNFTEKLACLCSSLLLLSLFSIMKKCNHEFFQSPTVSDLVTFVQLFNQLLNARLLTHAVKCMAYTFTNTYSNTFHTEI